MQKQQKKSLKKESGIKFKSLYRSIWNLPMYNWIKMRKNSDLSFLIKDESRHGKELKNSSKKILSEVYFELITEFFSEFGQSKSYKNELKLMKEITLLNLEYAQTGDTFLMNNIEVLKQKLENIKIKNVEREAGINSDEEMMKRIGEVSSSLGKAVNLKKLTVLSFYTQLFASKFQMN